MLASTSPDVSPEEVTGSMDFSVPWYAHAEVGLEKMTAGGDGAVPAWVHGVAAVVALALQMRAESGADGGEEPVPADTHA